MKARVLMFQGTGSDVGKSVTVAGLCRLFARRGLAVRPFKPQNMSNNAAVTADGGEIGRAQALQARACGVAPSVDMNPVLLKPESETRAQVILRGRVLRPAEAESYQGLKSALLHVVLESFECLRTEADLVLVEGAGSPAEVNLKERRRVVVVPRETPVSRSHLEHLIALVDAGATVLPASPGFYGAGAGATAAQLVDFVAGKVLDAAGVPHTLFTRWRGELGAARD